MGKGFPVCMIDYLFAPHTAHKNGIHTSHATIGWVLLNCYYTKVVLTVNTAASPDLKAYWALSTRSSSKILPKISILHHLNNEEISREG